MLLINHDTTWRWVIRDVLTGKEDEHPVCFWVLIHAKQALSIVPIIFLDDDLVYKAGGRLKRLPRE